MTYLFDDAWELIDSSQFSVWSDIEGRKDRPIFDDQVSNSPIVPSTHAAIDGIAEPAVRKAGRLLGRLRRYECGLFEHEDKSDRRGNA